MQRIIMAFLLLLLIGTICNCSTAPIIADNKHIDNTINDIKNIDKNETDIDKKIVYKNAVAQLETAKDINNTNVVLTKQIEKDKKYVKAGKTLYTLRNILIAVFVIIGLGLIIIKLLKFFKPL